MERIYAIMSTVNWKRAILLEQKVQEIITQQEIDGFQFNKQRARFYVHVLEEICLHLYLHVLPILKPQVEQCGAEISKPFTKSGSISARAEKYLGEQTECLSGPFTPISFTIPNISQRQKIIQILLDLGWKPDEFTDKGQPKLTDKGEPVETLSKVTGVGKYIADWYRYKHRQSQIKGLIERVREDGRISAGANTIGTNTCRMRHRNVVNIPKAHPSVIFGKQIRSLFTCRYKEGWRLLGGDASGLEARMEAHYTYNYDGGVYAKELLEGDVHSKNAAIFGVDRQTAKSCKYAITL